MRVSDFSAPSKPGFSAPVRYAATGLFYGVGVPITAALGAFGRWPGVVGPGLKKQVPDFGDYQPTASDVVICAYIKSGTTWLIQMALQIAYRGEAEFDSVHDVVPWPDAVRSMDGHIIPLTDPSPRQNSPFSKRVIKTHLPPQAIPMCPDARYIALIRDPKDVCVSSYHFFRDLFFGPVMPSVEQWVDFFLSPEFFMTTWLEHAAGWWAVRDRPNVLFMTYEEVARNHGATVYQVADFMDIELSEAEHAAVLHQSSFATMTTQASKFDPGQLVPWTVKGGGRMFRRGKTGASHELLSAEQQARIDEVCSAELQRLGCDFPYAETYGMRNAGGLYS